MNIVSLRIENFRSIKKAQFIFEGHTLLIGPNNIGKSTIFEAIDLVLGPDRLSRFPPIEEFDFYNAQYLKVSKDEDDGNDPILIEIELILTNLSEEVEGRCDQHMEFWNSEEQRILDIGELELANSPTSKKCLRLITRGSYNADEDEFEAQTFYSHSPTAELGELNIVGKTVKRMFGFIYLRTLRTGSRALSLERGSLLDIILRMENARGGLWEKAIHRLRDLNIEEDAAHLDPVLTAIEKRLGRYISSETEGRTTKLHVSQLTREHLRKTMAFFLSMSKDQAPVPFQQVGTGTLNVLVLALLSFIAELKPNSVIFAMEEPEIALPPHTQRRIAEYLLRNTSQAFVTSHSPFVIERFEPQQTLLLKRDENACVSSKKISEASGLKEKDFLRYARRGLSECILGKGAIVVEGLTEFHSLPVAARIMEENNPDLEPLDISGVAFFDAETESNMAKFGNFFKDLGLKTFSFYDYIERKAEKKLELTNAFDIDFEHPHKGFEDMIISEVNIDRQWRFLADLKVTGDNGGFEIPDERPNDDEIKRLLKSALKGNKGTGWAARLIESCTFDELPKSIIQFLNQVYSYFPKPAVNTDTELGQEEVSFL